MNTYQIVTDRIIKMVEEKGHLPWQQTWSADTRHPANITRPETPYKGINFWILLSSGFRSPYWMTFNQAKSFGGNIKKGEKGTMIVFWKIQEDKKEPDPAKKKNKAILRYYYVWNLEQVENIPESKIPKKEVMPKLTFSPIEHCEKILSDMPIPKNIIKHGYQYASYSPYYDKITMPNKESFQTEEYYYATLFHELSHATGHENRCNRKDAFGSYFGREKYSKEELVAEIASCYLCHTAGIENKTIDNSAAYLGAWLKVLKSDPRLIVWAASAAEKATNYILAQT